MSANKQISPTSTHGWNLVNPPESRRHRCQKCGREFGWAEFNTHIENDHPESQRVLRNTQRATFFRRPATTSSNGPRISTQRFPKPNRVTVSDRANPPQSYSGKPQEPSSRIVASWRERDPHPLAHVQYEIETGRSGMPPTPEGFRQASAEMIIEQAISAIVTAAAGDMWQDDSDEQEDSDDIATAEPVTRNSGLSATPQRSWGALAEIKVEGSFNTSFTPCTTDGADDLEELERRMDAGESFGGGSNC